MNVPARGTAFLREFKDFLAFLQNLWGILAGISVLFPLSNVLTKLIPLKNYEQDGVYDHLSPSLITAITTLVSLFIVLWTFGRRRVFKARTQHHAIRRQALLSFGLGISSLVIYLVAYFVTLQYAWDPWGWGSGNPRKLLAEVPLMISYSAFFALVTRAFVLLGMMEFFAKET